MKVELIEVDNKVKYPYIGEHIDSKVLVLFIERERGTVIGTGDTGSVYTIGQFDTAWHEDAFVPYSGKVQLSND